MEEESKSSNQRAASKLSQPLISPTHKRANKFSTRTSKSQVRSKMEKLHRTMVRLLLVCATCCLVRAQGARAWNLYEPLAETSRVVQAMAEGLSGPANQPPSADGYQQLLSSPAGAFEQPVVKPAAALASTLVEAASNLAQNVIAEQQTVAANGSRPSMLGKILETPATMDEQPANSKANNSVAAKIGQAAYQYLKPKSGADKVSSRQRVAEAIERKIMDQHERNLDLSGRHHQHLKPTKHRDNKITSHLLDSSASTGRDSPLSSLFGGFKSGVTSRSSIVKAISDNGIARTITSVGKSLGGNKYVAGAAAASALAALGLTVSKLFSPYFMSRDPMLGSGSSFFSSVVPPPGLNLGPHQYQSLWPAAQPSFFSGQQQPSSDQYSSMTDSASSYEPSNLAASPSQTRDTYINYKPVDDSFDPTASVGGTYANYYANQDTGAPSERLYPSAPVNGDSAAPTATNQLYSTYSSGSNPQHDQFIPAASMDAPIYSVRPPPNFSPGFVDSSSSRGASGRRANYALPLKMDDETRRVIQEQLQLQRKQRQQLISLLNPITLQQGSTRPLGPTQQGQSAAPSVIRFTDQGLRSVDGVHHASLSSGGQQSVFAAPRLAANGDLSSSSSSPPQQLISANSANRNNRFITINDKQPEPEARESSPLRSFAAPTSTSDQQSRQQRAWQFMLPAASSQVSTSMPQTSVAPTSADKQSLHRVSRTPTPSAKTTAHRQSIAISSLYEPSNKGLNGAGGGLVSIAGPSFVAEQASKQQQQQPKSGDRQQSARTVTTNLIQLNESTATDSKNSAVKLFEANSGTPTALTSPAPSTASKADGKLATGESQFSHSQAATTIMSPSAARPRSQEQQMVASSANEDSTDDDEEDNQQVASSKHQQWTAMPAATTSARLGGAELAATPRQQQVDTSGTSAGIDPTQSLANE